MTKIPHQGGKRSPLRAEARASTAMSERAQQRRMALQRFLDQHGLTRAELARRAGLANGNALTNFLNGRALSLATTTLEKICAVFPGTTIEELTNSRPHDRVAPSDVLRLPRGATLQLDLAPLLDVLLRSRTVRPATLATEATISLIWPRDVADPPP